MIKEILETISWKNEDVANYYENVPINILHNYTIQGGLDSGCDIDLVYPYIKHTQSLIEVGAGYGRVIHHLLQKGYTGDLYALERSKSFCAHLKKLYHSKAKIIHTDLQKFQPIQKVDAILWLWTSISEFPKLYQSQALSKLASWLNPNGVLIIDTIHHLIVPKNATNTQGQYCVLSSPYGHLYYYTPSTKEVCSYAKLAGFKYIQHIDYKTNNNRDRVLHLFSHVPIVTSL